ncbi:MAG: isopentenyl phosphate kinase [Candidatus Hodarchaeales archaeon]|jgi:isopentenyl phosphate kinase
MTIDLIIKIGGSCISDKGLLLEALKSKTTEVSDIIQLKIDTIDQIAEDLGEVFRSLKKIIVLTGVGTPGHYTVLKYKLHKGNDNTFEQHLGLLEAQIAVNRLRQEFLEAFLRHKLPVVQFYASSIYESDKIRITRGFTDNIERFLSLGMVPVISGDMVPDKTMGYSVLSGDQILADLAKRFKPKKIIYGSDVDGVFETDPKLNPNSNLIPELTKKELEENISLISGSDASGQMGGKLLEIKNLMDTGFKEIILLNLTKKNRLQEVLNLESVPFTRFHC